MAAPCCCYVTSLPALPLAIAALWFGAQAQAAPELDASASTSATAALVSGGVALVFSLLFLSIFLLYVVYVVFVIAAIGGGNF